jgi:hypothetical protein
MNSSQYVNVHEGGRPGQFVTLINCLILDQLVSEIKEMEDEIVER